MERFKNEAEAYRNEILPKARGEAAQRLQNAEAYKQAVVNKAQGDAERFLSVYNAYKQGKTSPANACIWKRWKTSWPSRTKS